MNYTFRGQVKVSDVQSAFNDFVNKINTIITMYNATNTLIDNIDLSVGSPALASGGYSLSVGGLKHILEAYDGVVLGCRAFRIDSTHIVVTDGMYFKDGVVHRIHSQILEGNGLDIFYDHATDTIGLTVNNKYPGTADIIMSLSPLDIKYLNEFRDVQLEGLSGYKLTIQKRGFGTKVEADNNTIHRFQGAAAYYVPKEGAGIVNFNDGIVNINVARGWGYEGGMHRSHLWVNPANFLFIPKGCNSPLAVPNAKNIRRTQYTTELNKDL